MSQPRPRHWQEDLERALLDSLAPRIIQQSRDALKCAVHDEVEQLKDSADIKARAAAMTDRLIKRIVITNGRSASEVAAARIHVPDVVYLSTHQQKQDGGWDADAEPSSSARDMKRAMQMRLAEALELQIRAKHARIAEEAAIKARHAAQTLRNDILAREQDRERQQARILSQHVLAHDRLAAMTSSRERKARASMNDLRASATQTLEGRKEGPFEHNTYKEEPLDAAARKFEDCRTAQRHLRHDDYMQHMRDKAETERGLQWSRAVRYAMAAQDAENARATAVAEAASLRDDRRARGCQLRTAMAAMEQRRSDTAAAAARTRARAGDPAASWFRGGFGEST